MSSKKAKLYALQETIGEISLADMRDNIKNYVNRKKRVKTKNRPTNKVTRTLSTTATPND